MGSPARKAQKVSDQGLSDPPTKRTRARSAHEELGTQGVTRNNSHTTFENTEGKVLDNDFAAIGVGGLLEADPRPTFVLNLDTNANDSFTPDFVNKAFQSNSQLKGTIPFKTTSDSLASAEFRIWIKAKARHETASPASFDYCGITWTGFKVQNRWLIISGQESSDESSSDGGSLQRNDAFPPRTSSIEVELRVKDISTSEDATMSDSLPSYVTPGTPDWTIDHPLGVGDLSPHVILARSFDWSQTPLGDMKTWSVNSNASILLRQFIRISFKCGRKSVVFLCSICEYVETPSERKVRLITPIVGQRSFDK